MMKFQVNPAAPYDAPQTGLWHDQHNGASGQYPEGTFSIYIPPHTQVYAHLVAVMIPDNTTAKNFVSGPRGVQWMNLAESYHFIVVFYEPKDGKKWNLGNGSDGRNEVEYIDHLAASFASKRADSVNALYSRDKSHVSLVGYEEGGAMALEIASIRPAWFNAVAVVEPTEADRAFISSSGNSTSYPFISDSTKGQSLNIPNKEIILPLWLVLQNETTNEFAEEYWAGVNKAMPREPNAYTTKRYVDSLGTPARVWVTRGKKAESIKAEDLYTQFLSRNGRVLGWPGGVVRETLFNVHHCEAPPGYAEVNQEIDGFVRRWIVYKPIAYNQDNKTPLVVMLHGYGGSGYSIAEESRWEYVAEQYGFILIFPQAYPNDIGPASVPVPSWNSPYIFPGIKEGTSTDDVKFLQGVIDWAKCNFNIDENKVYGSGHSNGSSMLFYAALKDPLMFSAIAPVGWMQGGDEALIVSAQAQIPIMAFMGEFDITSAPASLAPESANMKMLDFWTRFNKMPGAASQPLPTPAIDGHFETYTYCHSGVPMVSFTEVKTSPHSYLYEEALMIWEDFFQKFSRAKGGELIYDANPVPGVCVKADPSSPTGYRATFTYKANPHVDPNLNPPAPRVDPESITRIQLYSETMMLFDPAKPSGGAGDSIKPEDFVPGLVNAGGAPNIAVQRDLTRIQGTDLWTISLPLPSGAFEYRYIIDSSMGSNVGRLNDPCNPAMVNTATGVRSLSSMVYVPYNADKQGTGPWADRSYTYPRKDQKGSIVFEKYDVKYGVQNLGGTGTFEGSPDSPVYAGAGTTVSQRLGNARGLAIYLPYNYDAGRTEPYKVLYISMGNSGDQIGNEMRWAHEGAGCHILDNVIARGLVEPFIMVSGNWQDMSSGIVSPIGVLGYEFNQARHDLFTYVIPLVEGKYNVATNRNGRAFAGLSMGGRLASSFYLNNTDMFSYFGIWSAAVDFGNPDTSAFHPSTLYLSAGTWDFGLTSVSALLEKLTATGIPSTWEELPGNHDWVLWQTLLYRFAKDHLWR